MRNHMLIYHLLLPAAVVGVLVLFGVSFGSALGAGIAVGCVSMVLMMATGRGHQGHRRSAHSGAPSAHSPAPQDGGPTTQDNPQTTAGEDRKTS